MRAGGLEDEDEVSDDKTHLCLYFCSLVRAVALQKQQDLEGRGVRERTEQPLTHTLGSLDFSNRTFTW